MVSKAGVEAPRYARPFVVLFVGALVICALATVNAWPFPAWELFSHLRTDRQTGWEALAIGRSDHERLAHISSLPDGFRGFAFIMAGFSTRSAADRDAICAVWLRGAAGQSGSTTRLLRIYRLQWLLSERRGERPAPPRRTLAWICTAKGARAAS
jgi:hypothetical protein